MRRDLELDVVVGERSGAEARELVAADHDAEHLRGQPLDRLDAGVDQRSLGALGHAVQSIRGP